MSNMLLMCKNTPVMEINFDEGIYNVLDEKHLPYQLKGKIQKVADFSEVKTNYDDKMRRIAINKNYNAIISFLSSRVLPLTRKNAKKIYQLFGFEQLQDDISKAKIAITCKAVSLQDTYWFKTSTDKTRWEDVDLRQNSLSEVVAQVSLHGSSLTLNGIFPTTPELNGQGAYAKAWKRENDDLWLYKLGSTKEGTESKIEVSVSNILKKCNVNALEYLPAVSQDYTACKCKCMTSETLSILTGLEFSSYCNVNNKDFYTELMHLDAESIYKMGIVDYLISNRDRHGMNWGLYYKADSMEILGCHPLYDHNNAFDEDLIQDKNAEYLFDKRFTMQEFAKKACEKVDFYFTEEIKASDFISQEHYDSFVDRAKDLEISLEPRKEMDK